MDMRKGIECMSKILAKFMVAFILVKLSVKTKGAFIKACCYRRKEFILSWIIATELILELQSVWGHSELTGCPEQTRSQLRRSGSGDIGYTWWGRLSWWGGSCWHRLKAVGALTTALCTGQPQEQTAPSRLSSARLKSPKLMIISISHINLMLSSIIKLYKERTSS